MQRRLLNRPSSRDDRGNNSRPVSALNGASRPGSALGGAGRRSGARRATAIGAEINYVSKRRIDSATSSGSDHHQRARRSQSVYVSLTSPTGRKGNTRLTNTFEPQSIHHEAVNVDTVSFVAEITLR